MFEFRKGDVIEILKDTPELTNHEARHGTKASDWAVGLVERTQVKGSFPLNCVYAIPCVERPPEEFLVNQSCNTIFHTKFLPFPYVYTGICNLDLYFRFFSRKCFTT